MNIFSKNCVLLLSALGFAVLSATPVEARLYFSTEANGVHSPAFNLNQDDTSDDFVDLNFGTSAGAQLRYDVINDKFFLNRDLDLEANELQNFKIERLSIAPVCDVTSTGRMYFNTTTNQTFVCDGTDFQVLGNSDITGAEITDETIKAVDLDLIDITLSDFTNDLALTSAQIFVGNGANIATGVVASGDVTLSNTGVFTIADNAVDGTDLALGSDTAGDLMFYNGTDWARLPAGTAGQVLQVNGTADAPVWNNSTSTKYQFIDIFGCIRGSATAGTVAGGNSPVIRFDGGNNSQMRCAIPVPSDWQAGTDINVDVYYSPSDNTAGNVQFEMLHAAFGIGETVTSGSFADTVTSAQAISASSQLNIYELSEDIPAGTLAADDMLNINFTRTPGAVGDTYAGDINIHQLRISYIGKELQ